MIGAGSTPRISKIVVATDVDQRFLCNPTAVANILNGTCRPVGGATVVSHIGHAVIAGNQNSVPHSAPTRYEQRQRVGYLPDFVAIFG